MARAKKPTAPVEVPEPLIPAAKSRGSKKPTPAVAIEIPPAPPSPPPPVAAVDFAPLLAGLRVQLEEATRKHLDEVARRSEELLRPLREASEGIGELGRQAATLARQFVEARAGLDEAMRQMAAARQGLVDLRTEHQGAAREVENLRQQLVGARQMATSAALEDLEHLRSRIAVVGDGVGSLEQRLHEAVGRLRAEAEAPLRPAAAPEVADDSAGRNRLGVTVDPGVIVAEVAPGSPAAIAGLLRGDIIRGVNGDAVANGAELRDALQAAEGDEIALQVGRGGLPVVVKPLLSADDPETPEGRNRLGATVAPGVVIAEVLPDSPAAGAGLRPGDVVVAVNGHAVHTAEDLRRTMHQLVGREVRLEVTRGDESRVAIAQMIEPTP